MLFEDSNELSLLFDENENYTSSRKNDSLELPLESPLASPLASPLDNFLYIKDNLNNSFMNVIFKNASKELEKLIIFALKYPTNKYSKDIYYQATEFMRHISYVLYITTCNENRSKVKLAHWKNLQGSYYRIEYKSRKFWIENRCEASNFPLLMERLKKSLNKFGVKLE
jgi:hypothetical protein